MQFEHFAMNVADARRSARWYAEHCEMVVLRSGDAPPYVHFLGDGRGRVMMELYTNPAAPVPDYFAAHPLAFHFALAVEDPTSFSDCLVAAGASLVEDKVLADGSQVVMLRDPWGVPIQLCKRTSPLV